jgi:hypothetical protein
MHSHIAAYRFVHLRGLWFARPLHAGDVGPVVVAARDGETLCRAPDRRTADAVALPIAARRAA